jgi:hypothetical protein
VRAHPRGWDEVRLLACLADMKEIDYRNTLAVASLIELLVERGVVDPEALARKARQLDAQIPAGAASAVVPLARARRRPPAAEPGVLPFRP